MSGECVTWSNQQDVNYNSFYFGGQFFASSHLIIVVGEEVKHLQLHGSFYTFDKIFLLADFIVGDQFDTRTFIIPQVKNCTVLQIHWFIVLNATLFSIPYCKYFGQLKYKYLFDEMLRSNL